MEDIGKQLKELRLQRGYRQSYVADRIGLNRSTVSNIESSRRSLTLNTLKKFADFYNVDMSFFNIDVANFDESIDLVSRIEKIFLSNEVPTNQKETLYTEIMKAYLKSKGEI